MYVLIGVFEKDFFEKELFEKELLRKSVGKEVSASSV
jgi:hypothetical protein